MQKIKSIVKQINKLESIVEKYTEKQIKEKTLEYRIQVKQNEKKLEEILPEAFALVREVTKRVTGKRLYDVQLMGGYAIHQGRIAEIKAGEGKTLTESLPAYLNALTGEGVHIITTNEYLARRDYNEVGKIFEYLGLTVGFIYQGMKKEERKEAYQKDVTYGINTEFGFDYLRDNITDDYNNIVQRELNYAIIDEADSILIDEAQTPMIISQKKVNTNPEPYEKADKFVKKLKGITILKEEPKNRYQQEQIEKYDYVVDETYKTVELTQNGIDKAEEEYQLENYYDSKNLEIINNVKQALKANALLEKDVDYIIKEGKIVIIDEFTGRIMLGKRFTRGLHEALEAKEHLKIEESSVLMGSITTQNYFKMYKKLSGMTGTAKTSEKEFNDVYMLDVVKIPTNQKSQRIDKEDKIYLNEEEKYDGVIEEIKKSNIKGQPVLVGTTSIEKSEKLSNKLKKENIEHQVLNAKNNEQEAKIVEQAGKLGKVTIATNMAGRGTNIILGGALENIEERKKVIQSGGLKVIGTEKHESIRIDEQLRGRSGRQGEVGESIFYLSIDDELIRIYANQNKIKKYKDKKQIKKEIEKTQNKAEDRNYTYRKRLVQYDEVLNKHRKIIYSDRKAIVKGNTENIVKEFIEYFCNQIIIDNKPITRQLIEQLEKTENMTINKDTVEELVSRILDRHNNKKQKVGENEFIKIEKRKFLQVIDKNWIEHLEIMEELKENMELRVYGGYDPVDEYEKEGKQEFNRLIYKIKMNTVSQLLFACDYI